MKIIWKKDKKKFQLLFFIGLVIFIVSAFNSTTLNVDNEHDKIDEDFNKLKLSAPTIVINSPSSNDSFDATAPSFNVRFTNENYTWYTIGSNTTKIFFLGNDTIKQYAWDKAIEGNVNITFYANDSIGDTRGAYVVVTRDTINPVVVINSPADDDPFDATAPSFNVRITDVNRNYTWYVIQGNSTKLFFNGNETIKQYAWDKAPEGNFSITFYANDTAGNQGFDVVWVTRDTIDPVVVINSPADDDPFDATAPNFDVLITEVNIHYRWYVIQGNATKLFFTGNEMIKQYAWDKAPEGNFSITFYVNDTVGHQGSDVVWVTRDISAPSIMIISPSDNDPFNATAPNFNVRITDDTLNYTWYVIQGNTTKILFSNNGSIKQYVWDKAPEGNLSITFYANDTAGNQNSDIVWIIKDTDITPPLIYFINPELNGANITNVFNVTVEIIDINNPTWGNAYAVIYNSSIQLNLTMFYIVSLDEWTIEWSNISLYDFGAYSINITAIDSSNNKNRNSTSLNITFVDDINPPNFSYPPGLNNTIITSSDAFEILIDIIDDFSPPANGSVYLNISWNPTETYNMENLGNITWRFNWANISDYANGVYTITIWGSDSSLKGNNFSITFVFTLNIAAGGGPSPGGFDLLEFLLSPLGLMIIGSIAIGAIILVVVMSRRKGSREVEVERISVLTGKNLCELCEHFEPDSQFCRKFLVMKTEGQYDYCKGFKEFKLKKEEEIVPKLEELSEEEKSALLEPLKDTLCISCQYVDIQTRLCKKFMSYAQVKKGAFCKGYRVFQEKPEKEKGGKEKVKVPSVKLMGQQMCTVCIHYEPDSGFCKKFLTFKRLKPNEVCKGFKRDKDKNLSFIETTPSNELKSEDTPSSKDERIDKIVGMIGKEDDAPAKSADERMKVPPGQAIARNLCSSCNHFEAESGFCKKYLTYKQLRPGEICKGYKKIK